MDFRTTIDHKTFGVRATALLVRGNQIYLAKSPAGQYYCIGGAITVGETTEEAVRREVREEVGCEISVDQLAFVVETTFCQPDVNVHTIEFHYLVTPVTEPSPSLRENGTPRECEWMDIDKLDKIDLRPAFLKTALKDLDGQVKHVVSMEGKDGF
ncbi:NUDIX hydrolase [Streptococcus ovuberis]|uniref:NUDIX domain-containing protein n=1 Tax=Streptococcus ovuberis TaxID=1936207 RepID=A0A7X6S1P7_9STRE|nr:NUDIX domain-containing protein [Streptococcus ovuberis]NKZ20585.1 NUDIX domain-containing protein [Streptococcus ovuberis]